MKNLKNILSQRGNAPFFKRLIAYFIDWYCISVLTILPINLIYSMTFHEKNFESTITHLPLQQAMIAFGIGLCLTIIYLIVIPYKSNGQTLGKKMLRLRIVKDHQEKLDLKTLLLRNGIGLILIEGTFFTCSIYLWELMNIMTATSLSASVLSVLGVICIISMGLSVITADHRMLHDFIGKTTVIAIKK